MKIFVIQNPYSSRWTSGKRQAEIEQALTAAGLDYKLALTNGPDHAIELAAQATADKYDVIIAAGGDGTIGEVVNGILQGHQGGELPKLGVLPLGTANDLVNNLNLPTDIAGAVAVIAANKSRMIDVIQVNDRYFINNAGLGLEPYTTTVQERMTRVHGILRYLLAVLFSIFKNPQWRMRLEWDDGEYEGPVTLVSISNGAVTGGIFYTVPHADPFDGKLSFVYGYIQSRLETLQILPKTMKADEGNYVEHPAIHEHHSTWLRVHIEPGSPAHADGELFAKDIQDLEYRIYPQKLPILLGEE